MVTRPLGGSNPIATPSSSPRSRETPDDAFAHLLAAQLPGPSAAPLPKSAPTGEPDHVHDEGVEDEEARPVWSGAGLEAVAPVEVDWSIAPGAEEATTTHGVDAWERGVPGGAPDQGVTAKVDASIPPSAEGGSLHGTTLQAPEGEGVTPAVLEGFVGEGTDGPSSPWEGRALPWLTAGPSEVTSEVRWSGSTPSGSTTTDPQAAVEGDVWAIWSGRLETRDAAQVEAPVVVAEAPAVVAEEPVVVVEEPLEVEGEPAAELDAVELAASEAELGQGADPDSDQPGEGAPRLQAPLKGATGGEKFEVTLGAVDVLRAPGADGASPASPERARSIAHATREIIPELTKMEAGASEARIELRVGDETVVVNVRVKDGAVDVDISGVSRAELARIREELASRLPGTGLDMGDLRQGEERRRDWEPDERDGWRRFKDEDEDAASGRATERPPAEPSAPRGRIWLKA
ncbi:MAG: hypothetical protein CMH57_02310 [Myxococcales bacterium]|nr:hypothetical protein [Myxococcales bacterium]